MSYTEFFAKSGGSNLNAGTRDGATEPGTTAAFTYASGTWVQATGVFTLASGNPVTDGIAVGDWVSVYADGSTVTGFVAQVTARNATTITVDVANSLIGAAPADGTANRTLKVGGAWKGPNAASWFPLTLYWQAFGMPATPRLNLKNDQTYSMTAAGTNATEATVVQGYTATPGDLGRATIDGSGAGASYILFTSGAVLFNDYVDLTFNRNGATGNANGVAIAGSRWTRCSFRNMRGNGARLTDNGAVLVECEAYANNASDTATTGGITILGIHYLLRCWSHHNSTANGDGFIVTTNTRPPVLSDCIASANGRHGFRVEPGAAYGATVLGGLAYGNGSNGIDVADAGSTSKIYVESFLAVSNTGTGIAAVLSAGMLCTLYNVGTFGNGTATSGLNASMVFDSITLTAAPFNDPANGDFGLNATAAAAYAGGRGAYTVTAGYTGSTVSYPSVGAAAVSAAAAPRLPGRLTAAGALPGRI